jgi:hypothetical protein
MIFSHSFVLGRICCLSSVRLQISTISGGCGSGDALLFSMDAFLTASVSFSLAQSDRIFTMLTQGPSALDRNWFHRAQRAKTLCKSVGYPSTRLPLI